MDLKLLKQKAGLDPYREWLSDDLKQSGSAYVATCPFHDDRTPSLSIYKKDGQWLFKCFGSSCGEHGDVIEFVQKTEEVDFKEAIEMIAKDCGMDRTSQDGTKNMNINFDQKIAMAELERNTEAQQYLENRGISRATALWRNLGVYDFPSFGPCIAIPYASGDVKFRAINAKDKNKRFLSTGEPNSKLYGIEGIDNDPFGAGKLLIAESELDSITAAAALDDRYIVISVPSATGCLQNGKLNIEPEHLEKLRKFEGKIFVATDQDEAGETCAEAIRRALPAGKVRRLKWDAAVAKDIGELFTKDQKNFAAEVERLCNESLSVPTLWERTPTFANLPEKKYRWIVPDLVPAENVTLLTGDFGTFKTYLSYFLADAISRGGEFVKRPCEKHPVLVLDRENSHSTVWLRKSKVGELKNSSNVRIRSLFTDPQAPELDDPDLLEMCAEAKPVVIIDSLTDFHPGKKESDPDDMTEVFLNIRRLIAAGAAAVIVLHHVPKNGQGKAGAYRGTTSIPGAVSVAILLQKMKGKNKVRLKGFKSRDGEDQQIELKFQFGSNAVTYDVLKAGRDSDAQMRDEIEGYVERNDGCSANDVADNVKGRRKDVLAAIRAMATTGRLTQAVDNKLHCPLPVFGELSQPLRVY